MEEKWNIGRRTRVCAHTGAPLDTAQDFYSAVLEEDKNIVRRDYSPAAWPEVDKTGMLYYWKHKKIEANAVRKINYESLLVLFDSLCTEPDPDHNHDLLRYVLGLMLGRRRLLRLDAADRTEAGDRIVVFDKRDGKTREFVCPAVTPEQLADAEENITALFE